jgi:hypothetical protein
VNIGPSPPQQPQVYNAVVEHRVVTEIPVVRHGSEEVNISGEEAVPDANQTGVLDNTPIDYEDYTEYNNDTYDGYTDYNDDCTDETPSPSVGSSEDPEVQFLQETRGELRQRALKKAATALDNLFQERCACSMYNITPSATVPSNNVMQPSPITP